MLYTRSDLLLKVYFLYPGTYKEQVYITRSNIKIYGQTSVDGSYTGNSACSPSHPSRAFLTSAASRSCFHHQRALGSASRKQRR